MVGGDVSPGFPGRFHESAGAAHEEHAAEDH